MQDIVLTIFTPTYNRAYILPILFDSLRRQTNKSFEWMIIDDGSTDGTGVLVQKFIEEADFTIKYFYKENGGKHSAINMMLDIIDTEMVLIVDSDDYLSADAVETVLFDYNRVSENADLCELLYYRKHVDGRIIGKEFRKLGLISNPINEFINKGITGDRCNVLITNKVKKYRFPVFESEKFMGEGQLWYRMYSENAVYTINKGIYFCEYRDDGLSRAGRKLRVSNPLGGIEFCKTLMHSSISLPIRLKYTIMYICYGLLAKKSFISLSKGQNKVHFTICTIPGVALFLWWRGL